MHQESEPNLIIVRPLEVYGQVVAVPFEQLGVQEPVWLQTVGLDDCAEPGSPFRQIPSERDGTPGSFVQLFRYDLFHNI